MPLDPISLITLGGGFLGGIADSIFKKKRKSFDEIFAESKYKYFDKSKYINDAERYAEGQKQEVRSNLNHKTASLGKDQVQTSYAGLKPIYQNLEANKSRAEEIADQERRSIEQMRLNYNMQGANEDYNSPNLITGALQGVLAGASLIPGIKGAMNSPEGPGGTNEGTNENGNDNSGTTSGNGGTAGKNTNEPFTNKYALQTWNNKFNMKDGFKPLNLNPVPYYKNPGNISQYDLSFGNNYKPRYNYNFKKPLKFASGGTVSMQDPNNPYPNQPQDNIPAMLSEGEAVVNPEATSMYEDVIHQMNMQGLQNRNADTNNDIKREYTKEELRQMQQSNPELFDYISKLIAQGQIQVLPDAPSDPSQIPGQSMQPMQPMQTSDPLSQFMQPEQSVPNQVMTNPESITGMKTTYTPEELTNIQNEQPNLFNDLVDLIKHNKVQII